MAQETARNSPTFARASSTPMAARWAKTRWHRRTKGRFGEDFRGLIARGDVVVIGGRGTSGSPRQYATVEDFARLSGKKVRDTAHAKEIAAEAPLTAAEMVAAVQPDRAAVRSTSSTSLRPRTTPRWAREGR